MVVFVMSNGEVSADEVMLTPAQAAQRLGVTTETVISWIRGGDLRGKNMARNPHGPRPRYRVSVGVVRAFLASRDVTPAPTQSRRRRAPSADDVIDFVGRWRGELK